MNESVIAKAQELAAVIAQSPEYLNMRSAEDAATQDEALAQAFARYEEKRGQIEQLTMSPDPDFDQLGALSRELEELQEAFNTLPMAKTLQAARKDFTEMMNCVNHELSKVLSPEGEHEQCNGHCEGCHGCH